MLGLQGSTLAENSIAQNNQTGINLFDSRGNNITANTITSNLGIGVKLWYDADENSFTRNNITGNNVGILINDSFDNTVTANNIEGNVEWGMRFEGSQNNNVILQNNFVGNRLKGDGLQVSITHSQAYYPKTRWRQHLGQHYSRQLLERLHGKVPERVGSRKLRHRRYAVLH